MFVIRGSIDNDPMPRDLAVYDLSDDGQINFDETRGDPEFLDLLRTVGVPVDKDDGTEVHVLPSEGHAFHDACMDVFCGVICVSDERDLNRLQRLLDGEPQSMPPASVA